jgi:RNA-directed DNA polymerase
MSDPAIPGQLTRQQLYDRIRETSKDEYILSEMKRLGFWKEDNDKPSIPEQLIQRKGELERELNQLLHKQRRFNNPQLVVKEMRQQRMKDALLKREETKKKRQAERLQRQENWQKRQAEDIVWLGEEVSAGLANKKSDIERLTKLNLPLLDDAKMLAEKIGISVSELRFLSYQRKVAKINHYQRFYIQKKSGGLRMISAPMPRLKRVQYWILENILNQIPLHQAANGFVAKRSIVSNAQPHVEKSIVINLDLKDFFPTVTYSRIRGVFKHLGYSEYIATILALLCSEPDTDVIKLDGEQWFVMRGERHLPQGAPTSPAISNIICRTLDARLQGWASYHGFTYTRYADDMTFSTDDKSYEKIPKFLWMIKHIVTKEGFNVHPDKTRIMRQGNQQEVTGLIVNDKLSINRKKLKQFRALLFQIEKDGLQGKEWAGIKEPKHLLNSIQGYANFINMVNPEKGNLFKQQVKAILNRYMKTYYKN